MNEFLARHKIALTPLSPIHIGCGEDFEPTNYVIDAEQKLLYGFDPSRAILPENVVRGLESCCAAPNPLAMLQKTYFLSEHKKTFITWANVLVSVFPEVLAEYKTRLNTDFNQFIIERHVHQSHGRQLPYVPGSSLKGALRTGWLNRLQNEAPDPVTTNMETRLFCGDFQTSPLRLLKISDLMPTAETMSALLSANFRYKDGKINSKKLPPLIKECLLPGQYRTLQGDIIVQRPENDEGAKIISGLRPHLTEIAEYCHKYHLACCEKDIKTLCDNGLVNVQWRQTICDILDSLKEQFDSRRAMLVRLGRYGGAESKTLPRVARIKIHKEDYRKKTTTCWLAKPKEGYLPFGWAILEIDPQDDLKELKAWCESEAKTRPDMEAHYTALASERMKAEAEAERQKSEREAAQVLQRQAEEAEAKAAAERESRLAAMSEAEREIEALSNTSDNAPKVYRARR